MTDPERISKRSLGLAAQLLQAGAQEQPDEAGMQRTLAALGVSAAVVTTTSTATALAGTVKATSAGGAGLGATAAGGAVKAVSATLLVKWIGIGVVSGIGLAGAAAVATTAAAPSASVAPKIVPLPRAPATASPSAPAVARPSVVTEPTPVDADSAPAPTSAVAVPRVSTESAASSPPAALEVGAPLAAEVDYVDRARAQLASGRTDQGLALLQSYEREFPEARLLPEVLFLRMETCERLGRKTEARAAAQRLLEGFPKSPHASRARKLRGEP